MVRGPGTPDSAADGVKQWRANLPMDPRLYSRAMVEEVASTLVMRLRDIGGNNCLWVRRWYATTVSELRLGAAKDWKGGRH